MSCTNALAVMGRENFILPRRLLAPSHIGSRECKPMINVWFAIENRADFCANSVSGSRF